MANCSKCTVFYSAAVRPFCGEPGCPVAAIGMTAGDDDDWSAVEKMIDADWIGDEKY